MRKQIKILNLIIFILCILFLFSCISPNRFNNKNSNNTELRNTENQNLSEFKEIPKLKWSFEVFFIEKSIEKEDVKIHSRLNNYPVFFQGMIIFSTSGKSKARGIKSYVYALEKDTGKEIWKFEVDGSISTDLLLHDGKIYFGNEIGSTKDYWKDYEFNLYVVDATTGKLVWKFLTRTPVSASPIIYKDTLYFGTTKYVSTNENDSFKDKEGYAFLYALNLYSGKEKWCLQIKKDIYNPLILSAGLIYFRSGSFLNPNCLYAVNARNGKIKWVYNAEKLIEFTGHLLMDEENLYSGSFGDSRGSVFAIDRRNGEVKWKRQVDDRCWLLHEIHNDILIVGTSECYLYGINKNNGEVKWKFRIEGGIESKRIGALDGNILYVGSYYYPYPPISENTKDKNWNIYAIDIQTGKEIWKYEVEGSVSSIPLIYGNILLFGNQNLEREYECNYLYALNKITGKVIWKKNIPNKDYVTSTFPIIIENNTLFFGTENGFLYALSEQG